MPREREAALALRAARRDAVALQSLGEFGLADVEAAYRVQAINLDAALAGGARVLGRKIGLTSEAIQRQLGVSEPDYGFLLSGMDVSGAAAVDMSRLMEPRIEAEIAVRVSRDLPGDLTPERARDFIDQAMVAAEIVDSAIAGWRITAVDTISDNGSAAGFALGAPLAGAERSDLALPAMTMWRGEAVVSQGVGAACMGGPLHSLCWLARAAAARGVPVRAGEVVLTGALGPMVPVRRGDSFRIAVDGFEELVVAFSA